MVHSHLRKFLSDIGVNTEFPCLKSKATYNTFVFVKMFGFEYENKINIERKMRNFVQKSFKGTPLQ